MKKVLIKILTFLKNFYTKVILRAVVATVFGIKFVASKFKFLASPLSIKIIIWVLAVVALLQVVFGVMIYGFHMDNKVVRAVAKIVPYPIAIANQDFITYNQYFHEKDYIHHFYKATQQDTIDFTEIDKEIIDQLIENKMLAFQAMRYSVKVSKKDIDDAMNQIIDQNGGKDNVTKVLDDMYGLSISQFRNLVKTQMVREKINSDLIEKVTARHILVRVDASATTEQVQAAKDKITGYLNEINGGLDFGDAAKKYSEDTGSAENGGLLQPFAQGEMVAEFSKTAFSTEVGKISEPIKTEFGWHIIKVESKTGKINKSFDDWLSNLKKRSLIIKF